MRFIASCAIISAFFLVAVHNVHAQDLPWYGTRVSFDYRAASGSGAVTRLTQSCEYADITMNDGSRFPVTVEYLWYRNGSDFSFVYSRPIQVTAAAQSLNVTINSAWTPLTVAGEPDTSTDPGKFTVPGYASNFTLSTAITLELIDAQTGELLGQQDYLKWGGLGISTERDRTSSGVYETLDLRPYVGRAVRFRVMLAVIRDDKTWQPARTPAFMVTRPQWSSMPPQVVMMGPGGATPPLDVPRPLGNPTVK